jgi:hypothetical protein
MLTWNSPFSVGFDILFGVIPCIFIVFSCFTVILFTGNVLLRSAFFPESLTPLDANTMFTLEPTLKESLEQFPLAILSSIACFSLIVVSISRQRTSQKLWTILSLLLGCGTAAFLIYSLSTIEFRLFLTLPAIVAIKHIIMLTRA